MLIFTAVMQNHRDSRKSWHTTDKSHIIDDTDIIHPSLLCDLCPWLTVAQVTTTGSQVHNM